MTPAELMATCHQRAIRLWADGERLKYQGPRGSMTPELRAALSSRKPELLALLAGVSVDASPDDLPVEWRERWEERAAVMEYDGKQPREQAEAHALADILGLMRARGQWPERN